MKCTDLVIQDHEILRRGLSILDGMVSKLEEGARIEIADVVSIMKFLRLFGDQYHQNTEENILFPALMCAAPQESALAQILSEHSEDRRLVNAIENALKFKVGIDFVRSSRQLSVLLRSHLDKEDTVLGLIAEKALSAAEDNLIVAEFTKNYIRPESCVNFSWLERKYTSKPTVTPLAPGREIARARGAVG